jgi:hypothetical protein
MLESQDADRSGLRRRGILRTGCNLLALILSIAAVGCASSLPEGWTRIDKRQIDPKQLLSDRAICEGEIKANLTTSNQTTIWGPTEDARTVYVGCMVRHGYTAAK